MSKDNKKTPSKPTNPPAAKETYIEIREIKLPKSTLLLVSALILFIAGLAYFGFEYKSQFIAARLDSNVITRFELNKELAKRYGDPTLEDIIILRLIDCELETNSVEVAQEEIDANLAQIEAGLGGMDLDEALTLQNLTREELENQIRVQLGIEKLVSGTIKITEEDLAGYIEAQQEELEGLSELEARDIARKSLMQQRLQNEVQIWVRSLRDNAKVIKYL